MAKDSLIKGTIILAAAAFIARFLGVVQRVPLQHLLGDKGMATFGIANNIYLVLLIVATAGIPSALSKLVSERLEWGREEEAQRIFRAAVWFALAGGFVVTAGLYAAAPMYAEHISKDPAADWAIRALAPALLFFPLIAILRGYFQGHQMMQGNGISQIVEQFLRVGTAVGLAYLLIHWNYSDKAAVAGATFGGVMGSIGALLVMLYCYRKLMQGKAGSAADQGGTTVRDGTDETGPTRLDGYRMIYKTLFKLSVPICLISMTVPAVYMIDTTVTIALLEDDFGAEQAKYMLGLLSGRAQSIAGLPPILAIAISQSIVPIIASAYARSDQARLDQQTSQGFRLSILFSLPVVLILAVCAEPLNRFMYTDAEGTAIIIWLTLATLFQVMMTTSGAVLMGLGQLKAPMLNTAIGIAAKLLFSILLAQWLGIYGIIAASGICFAVVMLLNLKALRRYVQFRVFGRRWFVLLAVAAAVGAAGFGLETLGSRYLNFFGPVWDSGLLCVLLGLFLTAMYALLLMKSRLIGPDDLQKLPRPLRRMIGAAERVWSRAVK